MIIFLGKQPY